MGKLTEFVEDVQLVGEWARQIWKRIFGGEASGDRLDEVINADGRIWELPIDDSVPKLPALSKDSAAVVCVCNLKGGVGKTTIVANLSATLARLGAKVLIVDLDYQGSLTSVCLNAVDRQRATEDKRLVNLLFDASSTVGGLLERRFRVSDSPPNITFDILPADEDLQRMEDLLLIRWLRRDVKDDVRFRLRGFLHSSDVRCKYDVILLDCPPRLTTSCVNGIAAAHYFLIPTGLDSLSAERVPGFIAWLKRLTAVQVTSDLSIGIVANQTERAELQAREKESLSRLEKSAADRLERPIHRFARWIPDRVAFADAVNHGRFAIDTDKNNIRPIFEELARELASQVPALRKCVAVDRDTDAGT